MVVCQALCSLTASCQGWSGLCEPEVGLRDCRRVATASPGTQIKNVYAP